MANFDNLSVAQRLRASLHRDSNLICKESCHLLGLEMTKPAIDLISELVYKKLLLYGTDLEAFAKHAKRQTINADDVRLLLRRNPSLLLEITKLAPNATAAPAKDKRRKTVALPVAIARQAETPKEKRKEPAEKTSVADQPPEDEDVLERMMVDETIDLTFD